MPRLCTAPILMSCPQESEEMMYVDHVRTRTSTGFGIQVRFSIGKREGVRTPALFEGFRESQASPACHLDSTGKL